MTTNALTGPTSRTSGTAAGTASAASGGSVLGEDAFLKLLTTQLANQDPLKPMDDTQSIAQLAQFSALQSQNELKTSFESFQSNFGVMQAATLIGKTVQVQTADASGNTSSLTGTVQAIQVVNGQPQFTLAGADGKSVTDANGNVLTFATSQIVGIR